MGFFQRSAWVGHLPQGWSPAETSDRKVSIGTKGEIDSFTPSERGNERTRVQGPTSSVEQLGEETHCLLDSGSQRD